MSQLVWDNLEDRVFENGVDHGVLYIPDSQGVYDDGVAWNGLVSVTESPEGGETNKQYADNIPYLNIRSVEMFKATIEAFTYPDEFDQFNGLEIPTPGVAVGQQDRKSFGLCYRTNIGNALDPDLGYKLHLVYGCTASPSEKAYTTINESPEALQFSWEIDTLPVAVTGLKPTSQLTIDSTKVDAGALADLETILYGSVGIDPALPLPDVVIAMFEGTVTQVGPLTAPAYDAGTDTITIPSTVGVTYYINDIAVPAGPVVITADTIVVARPNAGYVLIGDDDWFYDYTP